MCLNVLWYSVCECVVVFCVNVLWHYLCGRTVALCVWKHCVSVWMYCGIICVNVLRHYVCECY